MAFFLFLHILDLLYYIELGNCIFYSLVTKVGVFGMR